MIQSSYSFPNIINPFLAGLLIDKIGLRIGKNLQNNFFIKIYFFTIIKNKINSF